MERPLVIHAGFPIHGALEHGKEALDLGCHMGSDWGEHLHSSLSRVQ